MKCKVKDLRFSRTHLPMRVSIYPLRWSVAREKDPELKESDALKTIMDEYWHARGNCVCIQGSGKAHISFLETDCKTTVMVCPLFRRVCRSASMGRIALHADCFYHRCILFHLGGDGHFRIFILCHFYLWLAVCLFFLSRSADWLCSKVALWKHCLAYVCRAAHYFLNEG